MNYRPEFFAVAATAFGVIALQTSPAKAWEMTIDPDQQLEGWSPVETSTPAFPNGTNINTFLGANRFYSAGFTGQDVRVMNVEGGHVWTGHEALTHVTNFTTGTGAIAEFDRHATAVGMLIGGRTIPSGEEYRRGIAHGADLRSGAIATSWNGPAYTGSFGFGSTSLFTTYSAAFGSVDVINSSWAINDVSGFNTTTIGTDGLARANPSTTFVAAAGNSGPGSNTVRSPAAGYNNLSVASLGPVNSYDTASSFSSRGPSGATILINGNPSNLSSSTAMRATIDLAAPGEGLVSAYYGGQTGGNRASLSGSPNGSPGSSDSYLTSVSGTSFAAPLVAGGVALLNSASRNTPALAANASSRDARVMKAVLLNSADKTTGWNNGQTLTAGITRTTQSLDYIVGAGRMNLTRAFDQYLSGTTDVVGTTNLVPQAVLPVGWDFAAVSATHTHNDYVISSLLGGGTNLTVTLDWFHDSTFVSNTTVTYNAMRNLDLQVWDALFTTLIAESVSTYNEVEHLSFLLPADGLYGVRVMYNDELYGAAASENYGLAWSGTAVPEPSSLLILLVGPFVSRRRRRS